MAMLLRICFLGVLSTGCLGTSVAPQPGPGRARLAINLAGPADWNTELPFVDLMHFSRDWISQQDGKGWGQGPKLDVDEHGWVKRLPAGVQAETFLTSFDQHYPRGNYVVLWDGDGDMEFGNSVEVQTRAPHRAVLSVEPSRGPFSFKLTRTNPQNPLRNMRVLMPGTEATYKNNPFSESFLRRWRGVAAIRFMDWMLTNNSSVRSWNDRPLIEDANWCRRGIPVEVMVDLANRLHADPWFCMPHLADDGYVRQFSKTVATSLNPSLKAYVEYSNEVWNGQFEQQKFAGDQGLAARVGDKHWEAGWHWYARRATQVFDIWSAELPKARLVRVLASQAGNAYVSDQILGFQDAYRKADALAIAPYFGLFVGNEGETRGQLVQDWKLTQVFAYLKEKAIPEATRYIRDNKDVARKYGLPLIAYEGGQHCVGIMGNENNEKVTNLLISANRDARMGPLYDAYYRAWEEAGGGLFASFSSVGGFSKWGSWGLMENADDDIAKSPKYTATVRWANHLGQGMAQR